MNQPPKTLNIELSEEELHDDLKKILVSMENIRNEQINNNKVSEESKNEYLHLTYRLASVVRSFASDEKNYPGLVDKMQNAVNELNDTPALVCYDVFQDDFWRQTLPNFSESLDKALIQLRGDMFSGLHEKHHLLNAIKYIAVEEEPLETKVQIYNTILPFNDTSKVPYAEKTIKKFGKKIKIDKLKLIAEQCNDVDKLVNMAGYLGFSELKVVVDIDEVQHLESTGRLSERYKQKEEPKPKKWNKFWRRLINWTAPISYPAIGSLPHKYHKKLEDYLTNPEDIKLVRKYDDYEIGDRIEFPYHGNTTRGEITCFFKNRKMLVESPEHTDLQVEGLNTEHRVTTGHFKTLKPFLSSILLEASIGAGVIYSAGVSSIPGWIIGGYLIGEGVARAIMYFSSLGKPSPFAVKISEATIKKLKKQKKEPDLGWYSFSTSAPKEDRFEEGLVRVYVESYSQDVENLKKLPQEIIKRTGLRFTDNRVSILVPKEVASRMGGYSFDVKELFNTKKPRNSDKNYHAILEELAQNELDEKLEQNLEWNVENHFTQGKYFSDHLLKNKGLDLEKKLEPVQGVLSFYGSFTSGQYHKYWALTCQKGRRHVMTLITKKEFNVEELNKALSEKNDFDQKLSELTKKTEAEYLHLSEFFGNKKFKDKTFMR